MKKSRQRTLGDVLADARSRTNVVAGVIIKSVANEQQQNKPVKVELRGSDFRELKTVSSDLIRWLLKIDGIRDIESNLSEGDP